MIIRKRKIVEKLVKEDYLTSETQTLVKGEYRVFDVNIKGIGTIPIVFGVIRYNKKTVMQNVLLGVWEGEYENGEKVSNEDGEIRAFIGSDKCLKLIEKIEDNLKDMKIIKTGYGLQFNVVNR